MRAGKISDAAIAAVIAVIAVLASRGANAHQSHVAPLDFAGYALLVVGPIALLLRRRHPLPVLLLAFVVTVGYVLRYGYGPVFLALVVAFLTAAPLRRATYALLPIGLLALGWPVPWLLGHGAPDWWFLLGIAAWLAVLVSMAEGIRQRRVIVAERDRRREAARQSAEQDRLRRASEERLAIARELHDVLAHSLSLINVQSSVALELFDAKPEQAAPALAAIKAASKDALGEVHSLLTALRSGADPAPVAPAPSIADLDEVVARARDAGIEVATVVTGTRRRVPSVVDVAAARIVRESLTNVARHADGARATVELRYSATELQIRVDNDGAAAAAATPQGGSGIRGMRERAQAIGGTLTAGPRRGGGFRVEAHLPVQEEH